jgi:hypothetical protein
MHSIILNHLPRPVFFILHRFSTQQEKPHGEPSPESNSGLPTHYQLVYPVPQLSYAAPQLSYAAPRLNYAAPQLSCATTQLSYAVSRLSYGAPKLSYATPNFIMLLSLYIYFFGLSNLNSEGSCPPAIFCTYKDDPCIYFLPSLLIAIAALSLLLGGGGGGGGSSIELNRDTFLSPTIRRGGGYVGPSLLRKYMFESKEN